MTTHPRLILVVGATGSVGGHVVASALKNGFRVRALVRDPGRARGLPPKVEIVPGDLTRPRTLGQAVAGVDAIAFTHGSHGGQQAAEAVDYGGVRNVLEALDGIRPRIALMTAIGAADRKGAHDWKRRAERLVRASGLDYTIVRPGWFDCEAPGERRLVLSQENKPLAGSPADGAIARDQLAEVMVRALISDAARRKTFVLTAETGAEQADFDPIFNGLRPDVEGALDSVYDADDMALDAEPPAIRASLEQLARARH